MSDSELGAENWNQRYESGAAPWDLGSPTPEFERVLRENKLPFRAGRAIVPGGGRGHDALLLARHHFDVDLIDFAPTALLAAQEAASQEKLKINAFQRDFFDLPNTPYHCAAYDLFLEYTFFCAIDPSLRAKYVQVAAALLKPKGILLGLFFPLSTDKPGPPFLVSRKEVEDLFSPYFELNIEEPKLSVKPRQGREFLAMFQRKSG